MNALKEMSNIAISTEFVQVVSPNASDMKVRRANKPTGRRLSTAKRSAIHPQRKYPTPHAAGGIHRRLLKSACDTCIPRLRYSGMIVKIGPGEIAGSA